MQKLKRAILDIWPLRFIILLVLRPSAFGAEFIYPLRDFAAFRDTTASFRDFLQRHPKPVRTANAAGLLLVSGNGMNVQWCQLWAVLAAVYPLKGYTPSVLTWKNQVNQNRYFRLFGIREIYLDDLATAAVPIPPELSSRFDALQTFLEVKEFEFEGVPLGKMALSTYSRLRMTGITDIDSGQAKAEVRHWLEELYRTGIAARALFRQHNIEMLFFTEVFMEEYGALYYAALQERKNIIRFAGTVRDNAIVVQHLTPESDRTHFSSFSKASWTRILQCTDLTQVEAELRANFMDRYGDRWALSSRNQPNTKIVSGEEARRELGIAHDRKVAVIYSHILYDTLFFNGEDVFANYAEWLIETVKAACANPNILWFVKVHPSNLWRGELTKLQGGTYEEVRLIQQHVGDLPEHVRLIYPDTPFSPYTWLQIADCGITVRGTSGIELGALGKTVITAGTGRYESAGFSINPRTVLEYMRMLAALPSSAAISADQARIGKLFAFATFCMKPFTLDFFTPKARAGKTRIFNTDDLVFEGAFNEPVTTLPSSIADFVNWSYKADKVDFLSRWSAIRQAPLQTIESAE